VLRIRALHLGKRGIDGAEIEFRFARMRRYAKPAAEIQDAHVADAFGKTCKLPAYAGPVHRIQDAGTEMRVQPDDAYVVRAREIQERAELVQWQTELAGHTAGADLVMVAEPAAEVHAQHDLAPGEQLRPLLQRMQRVQRGGDAAVQRQRVIRTRREIRGEQAR